MADNIAQSEMFLGRKPAWHSFGTVIGDEKITPAAAVSRIGADYQVATVPVTVEAFGTQFQVGKRVAIVRGPMGKDPEPHVMGFASDGYRPLQNTELAEALAPLAKEWPVETLGVLGQGERFFMTLSAGSVDITRGKAKDQVDNFFLVTDGKNGGASTRIAVVPIRVVCQNTLTMALQAAYVQQAVIHRGDNLSEVRFAVDVISQLQAARVAVNAAMQALANTNLSKEQAKDVILTAYPDPAAGRNVLLARQLLESTVTLDEARQGSMKQSIKKHDDFTQNVSAMRDTAFQRFEAFNDENPAFANTGWAVVAAVTEAEDHIRKGRNVGEAAIFGYRATIKAAAINQALTYAR